MLVDDLRTIKSGPKELRDFAWVMGVASGVVALFLFWKESHHFTLTFVVSCVLLVMASIDTFAKAPTSLQALTVNDDFSGFSRGKSQCHSKRVDQRA